MGSRARRPSAFEVSGWGEQDPGPPSISIGSSRPPASSASRTSSSTLVGSSRNSSGNVTPLKRPSELGSEDSRASKRRQDYPPVAYYQRRDDETIETEELVVPGEDPEDDEEYINDEDKKPIRLLTGFSIFDPKHRNEMISLGALDTDDGLDRQFEAAGYVKAHYGEREDSNEEEEEGSEQQDLMYVRLGAILRYSMDLTKKGDPAWIETQYSWYILRVPSDEYSPYFQQFFRPRSLAQSVFTTVLHRPSTTYESFVQRLINTVDVFGRTWLEGDLREWANEIHECLDEVSDSERRTLLSSPLVKSVLRHSSMVVTQRPRRPPSSRHRNKHVPANRLVGNPDLAVLRAENQNATHVTPRIAQLAYGLVQEELQVVGPRPRHPNAGALEKQRRKRHELILKLMDSARKSKRKVSYRSEDKVFPGSKHVTRIVVDGEEYKVGDVILTINDINKFWNDPGKPGDPVELPPEAGLYDFFWFAKIHSFDWNAKTAHVRWFEHGAATMLQELANPQEMYYTNICDHIQWDTLIGKATVHMNASVDAQFPPDEFYCRQIYDKDTSSWYTIPPEDQILFDNMPQGANCPSCARDGERQAQLSCVELKDDNGCVNGFAYRGHKYHLDEFVLYSGEGKVASIGYITKFELKPPSRHETVGFVVVRKVGRIMDLTHILPSSVLPDERHLFLTDETANVSMDALNGTIYVPCLKSLEGRYSLQQWADLSPLHFFMEYQFPTLGPKSWRDRKSVACEEQPVCAPCWKDKLQQLRETEAFFRHMKQEPLSTLELFAGVCAFSKGLSEGSRALKVTHAVEISPSAAKTIQRNHPNVQVYNQCANLMLRHFIKTWEGHKVEMPTQLYDDNVKVPPPPEKKSIKVIVAGFPCQSHSSLNRHKRADDVKNNLMFTTLSFVDALRPEYVFLENVPGFLSYRLGARQCPGGRIEGGIEMGGLKIIVRGLLDMGYQVRFNLNQAAHYGAPQDRIRFILSAAQQGSILPEFPQPSHGFPSTSLEIKLPYGPGGKRERDGTITIRTTQGTAPHYAVTIEDAISDLPRFDWRGPGGARARKDEFGREIPSILVSKADRFCGLDQIRAYHTSPRSRFQLEVRGASSENSNRPRKIQHYTTCWTTGVVKRVVAIPLKAKADYRALKPVDQEWQIGNQLSYMGRGKWKPGVYGRLDKKEFFHTTVTNVSPTAKQSWVLNPWCKRVVTVRELARSQGFPDDFVFETIRDIHIGTMHHQIGNAVPLPLGRAVGRELGKALFKSWKNNGSRSSSDSESDADMEDLTGNRLQQWEESDEDDMYV